MHLYTLFSLVPRSLLKKLQTHDTEPHEFGQVFIRTVHTIIPYACINQLLEQINFSAPLIINSIPISHNYYYNLIPIPTPPTDHTHRKKASSYTQPTAPTTTVPCCAFKNSYSAKNTTSFQISVGEIFATPSLSPLSSLNQCRGLQDITSCST